MKKLVVIIGSCLIISISAICFLMGMFPRMKYRDIVSRYCNEYNLDMAMVCSIINIESGFDSDAKSSAGAIGLMQLLPSTAFDCADRINIEISEEDIFDEEKNIRLGCFYINYLLEVFDGDLVNTLCAYNWGLGNVRDWIVLGNVNHEGTIAEIPVKETRNYLRKYKLNYFVYSNIYKLK